MNVNISIDGVLRNTIEKFEYHYNDYFFNSDTESENDFEYGINQPIKNDNLLDYFKFQSIEEYEHFLFIEFPLEIFGHAKPSYNSVFSEINKFVYFNKKINFTIIGLDEKGKSKPASLFFLSKNNFLGNNIKFITSDNIKKEWRKCDIWITDNENIIKLCPKNKHVIKFNTIFNKHISNNLEINSLIEIQELWSKFSENTTLLTSMPSQNLAEQTQK